MDRQLRVEVAEEGADDERLDTLARYLREELTGLDVEGVVPAPGGEAPEGARVVDVLAIGGLLVDIVNTKVLHAVVNGVRRWLGRSPEPTRTVRLEVDGDVLELSAATSADQERLVALFLARHDPSTTAS